jgi:hypothetical protein
MKSALEYINFLFLTLSLTLIMADCNFIGAAFPYYHINSETACMDFTSHNHDSNTVCFEDVLFLNDSLAKPSEFSSRILLLSNLYLHFQHNFQTSIWQPPKRT